MNAVIAADYMIPAAGEVVQIVPGLLWLRMPLPFELDHINLYLIEDSDGWVVVDCGLYAEATVSVWEEVIEKHLGGKPVKQVVVTHTHVDHVGAAGWLCKRFDAPLGITGREYDFVQGFLSELAKPCGDAQIARIAFLHRLGMDAKQVTSLIALYGSFSDFFAALPEQVMRLEDGEALTIGEHRWQILVSEGHSVAHASLYSPSLGILISGDQVLPRISSNVSVGPHDPEGNPLRSWLDSLMRLKSLPADTLVLPAHDYPFVGIRKRLDDLIDGHRHDLLRVEELCAEPMHIVHMVEHLYPRKLSLFNLLLACGECQAHLHYLMHQGRICGVLDQEGRVLYQHAPAG
jgi:glyoxylase-like metal-dependent hydrolase (beta-lactamase superfamily II)